MLRLNSLLRISLHAMHVRCALCLGVLLCTALLGHFSGARLARAEEPAPDFAAGGKAFLETYCIRCHGPEKAEADLRLSLDADSKQVAQQRKSWEKVLKMVSAGEMPPQDEKRPTTAEAEKFTELIAAVFDHADRHAKPDPGRVTMRRLNRVEYQNTVRDLIGIDFDPTENFPADDIGHGFDNIGDVLSLSPVLMERYLEAAESIMSRAIFAELPAVTRRNTGAKYAEPAGDKVEKNQLEGRYRWIASDGEEPIATGPIFTTQKFDDDGEYRFKVKLYATSEGDSPVEAVLLLQGNELKEASSDEELARVVGKLSPSAKIVKSFQVTARKADEAMEVEVTLPPAIGRSRAMVGLVKPAEGQPPAKLFIQSLNIEGPLDMRPVSQRKLLAVTADQTVEQNTREVLSRFLLRAFRRATTDDELSRYTGLVEKQMQAGVKWEAAMQLAMQAVLCSPKFLFRVELDDRPTDLQMRSLDEYQLASRLSYFLWCSMPDDELLGLAGRGELTSKLDAQVTRMLADPRAVSLVDNFAMQWLQLQRIASFSPDPKMFPQFSPELRKAMVEETRLFVQSIIKEDRSILDMIDADYTYLNDSLARHYGLSSLLGDQGQDRGRRFGRDRNRVSEFKRVQLSDRKRGGLLTQASVLAVTSNPTRTSPVKRGRWVLEQILGAPPPPPPPNVPELPADDQSVATGSLRQRLEIHRQNPSCANCHAKMDPIGFALENFDAVGAYRTKDGEFEIDASGEFPDGSKFGGPEDLKNIVKERKAQFTRCLTEKLLTYALGRGIEYYDRPTVEKILKTMEAGDYKFSLLVQSIVSSDAFRYRRGLED